MKKFVLAYYGKIKSEDIKPEDMKSTMDKWMSWFGTFKDQMVDGGNPFSSDAMAVTNKGVSSLSAEMNPAKGYTIINAKDMDEATNIAKGCPNLEDDSEGAVHVYEAMPM